MTAQHYLPAAQLFFTAVSQIAPQSPRGFQAAAMLLDLGTGWLVMDLLRRLGLERRRALLYLWNPLVMVEFAHGAHVEAWMICLVVLAFWLAGCAKEGEPRRSWRLTASALSLAAATLTKIIPLLLLPLFLRRWSWKRLALFGTVVGGACAIFVQGAGWGLTGRLDGTGLFGALRIYLAEWNYNSSIYHWFEVLLSGYRTPGAVPVEAVGEGPIWAKDSRTTKPGDASRGGLPVTNRDGAPLVCDADPAVLAILAVRNGGREGGMGVDVSIVRSGGILYLTYIDPVNLREYPLARGIEYVPFYGLLAWTAVSALLMRWGKGDAGG